MSIEEQLKEYILKHYKSLRDFCMRNNFAYSTISNIFKRGIMGSSVSLIISVCDHLDIEVDALASGKIVEKEVESFLRGFCRGDLLDEEFRRKLINTLINCVYIFDDKIVIYYNIRGGKQISYIDMLADVDALSEPGDPCSDSLRQGEPNNKLSEQTRFIFVNGYFGVVISRG